MRGAVLNAKSPCHEASVMNFPHGAFIPIPLPPSSSRALRYCPVLQTAHCQECAVPTPRLMRLSQHSSPTSPLLVCSPMASYDQPHQDPALSSFPITHHSLLPYLPFSFNPRGPRYGFKVEPGFVLQCTCWVARHRQRFSNSRCRKYPLC